MVSRKNILKGSLPMFLEDHMHQIEWDDEIMMVGDLFFLLTPIIKTNCKLVTETFDELYKHLSFN